VERRATSQLRDLGLGVRIGLAAVVCTVLGGLLASAAHLRWHHEGRDERPGLSLDDLRGAYEGIRTKAPLLVALERRHPEDLADRERDLLLRWLEEGRWSETYDDLDRGEDAPAEVMARACTSCHSRSAKRDDDLAERYPLDYWDDVKRIAVSREVLPTPVAILAASTHTHALGLASITILIGALAMGTASPRRWRESLAALAGLALLADLAGWWIAREVSLGFWLVLLGGTGTFVALTLLCLTVLFDLFRPRREHAP